MNLPEQIARHLREVYFGGNWSTVNLKETLADVTWQEAITQLYSFNTIGTLLYHVNYYVNEVGKVMGGAPLTAKDEYSFTAPPIRSAEDWTGLMEKAWADAERLARLIYALPGDALEQPFTDPKYGSYYRNFHGIIEHIHYHLGQITLIKKMLRAS